MHFPFIYLASASPRRHELLTQMGVPHTVVNVPAPPGEDEPQLPGEHPHDYVERTAHDKARQAMHWLEHQPGLPQAPVLTADTTVILGDTLLGKPADLNDAARILRTLSGQTHEVRTAVVLAHQGHLESVVSVSRVRFQKLTDAEIDGYCASGEPLGKAGAYGIQGLGGIFVEHLDGSYTGVMGLPVHETAQLLRSIRLEYPGRSGNQCHPASHQ